MQWTTWGEHFAPLSGHQGKIREECRRKILTTFAYGTGLGPTQTAKNIADISARQIEVVPAALETARSCSSPARAALRQHAQIAAQYRGQTTPQRRNPCGDAHSSECRVVRGYLSCAARQDRRRPVLLPDVTAICAASMEAKLQSTGPVRVIFVGKEARRKGLDVLARAFASLPSAIQSQLRVQVVSRMLDGPVELPAGWEHIAYAPDVHALMRQADVLAFPTKVEAYGLVLVEGLAAGCAVITTKAPLQRSIVGDDAGYFVDPNDHATVALALSHVVEDRAKLASRIRAARARFESRYQATIVGRDYHRLLWATSGKTPPP